MVGTVTPIYCSEESLPSRGIRTRYRGRPARARGEQNNRSLAQSAEYFCEEARASGAFLGKHWRVRCRATAFQSPCRHFCLGLFIGGNRTTAICSTCCGDYQEPDRFAPWTLRKPSRGTRVASRAKLGLLGQVIWPCSLTTAAVAGRGGGQ